MTARQIWEGLLTELSKVKFETVSMDFIFALPGQSIEDLKDDVDKAFYAGANHIAVYPFIDFAFTKQPVIDTIMIQIVIIHIKIICVEVFCIFLLNEVRIRKYTIKMGYKISVKNNKTLLFVKQNWRKSKMSA